MYQIDQDFRARQEAKKEMVENCLEVAHDQYGEFDHTALEKKLNGEETSRLRTFLDTPKYRRSYIKSVTGKEEIDFYGLNFEEILKQIQS